MLKLRTLKIYFIEIKCFIIVVILKNICNFASKLINTMNEYKNRFALVLKKITAISYKAHSR